MSECIANLKYNNKQFKKSKLTSKEFSKNCQMFFNNLAEFQKNAPIIPSIFNTTIDQPFYDKMKKYRKE